MRTLSPSIVLVKNIHSTIPQDQFPADKIEQGAQLILAIEGVINPLILRREGMLDYQIIAGHFEYYAAKRARELDLERGESINAYIVETEKDMNTFINQLQLFRKESNMPAPQSSQPNPPHIDQVLQQIGEAVHNFATQLLSISSQIKDLSINTLPVPPSSPSESFPTIEAPPTMPVDTVPMSSSLSTELPVETSLPPIPVAPELNKTVPVPQTPLEKINTLPDTEVITKLSHAKPRIKTEIIDAILKSRPFSSLEDLTSVKGIGEKTLENIKKAFG